LNDDAAPRHLKESLRFQIVVFSAIRMVVNTSHRMVYPFLPVFSRGLGVDLPSLSLALTTRGLVGVFGPFLASIADSRGRKTGMLFGMVLFSGGVSLVVLYPTFPAFVLALIFTTLSKYTFDPAMQAYLGDRIAYRRRGLAMAITELGWSFSFIVGVPLVGYLIARGGWMAPFPLLSILGLVSLLGLAWMLPRDQVTGVNKPNLLLNLRSVFTYQPAVAGLLVGLFISTANEVVNLVFGVWMESSFGLRIAALGVASAVIGFSELGGETMVGALVDRLGKARSVGIGLILNCIAALALPVLGTNLPGAFVGLFIFYLTFEFTLVSTLPLMTEILPASRATLMAANVASHSLGRATGALIAVPIFGLGFYASTLAAVLFNLLALAALARLRRGFVE
jgi:MFS transporter, DHA1 family, inner membrane transport protein